VVDACVALGAVRGRVADPEAEHDLVAVVGDQPPAGPVWRDGDLDRARAGDVEVLSGESEPAGRWAE
jgi:hypothetical protein